MRGWRGAVVVGACLLAMTVILLVGGGSPAAEASPMCPPVTLDSLYPSRPTPNTPVVTTTTTPAVTTSTTTTTTVPTTTVPEESTTTLRAETSTTASGNTPATTAPPEPACEPFVYDMSYPMPVNGKFLSRFGSERDQGERWHKGIDLEAPKLTPVLATADGTVIAITNEIGTEDCCWLAVRHRDGWQSYYVHLNNDTYGTDDGQSQGVRIDLEVGDEVKEGEVLGWLGDSGNAEDSIPHLHYELRLPDGRAIDAKATLNEAAGRVPPDTETAFVFEDVDGALYPFAPSVLAARGILWSCDDLGLDFCPDLVATPDELGALAAMLAGADVPALEGVYPRLTLAGQEDPPDFLVAKVLDCAGADDCRATGFTEKMLAQLAVAINDFRLQTLISADGEAVEFVIPPAGDAEQSLRDSGVLGRCYRPLDGVELLTRSHAAHLLLSWTGYADPDSCEDSSLITR